MGTYLIRRILLNLVVVWLVMTFVFVAVRVLPGDYAAAQVAERYFGGGAMAGESAEDALNQARERLGLNDPIAVQYAKFLRDAATLDFGRSFVTGRPVFEEVARAVPYTLQIALMSFAVAIAVALPVGIVSAMRQDSWLDGVLRLIAVLGLAAPSFWLATIGTLLVLRYDLFKIDIINSPGVWEEPRESLQLFLIPALAAGVSAGAFIMRMLRSQMLDVLRQDYVRTAWSKGLRTRVVILRHVLKNALIPVITASGVVFGSMIGGSVILESMFNIPGVGRYTLSSLQTRDVPVVQAMALTLSVAAVMVNLLIDISYFKIDPRISVE